MDISEEIAEGLAGKSADQFVSEFILDRVPFLFGGDMAAYQKWRASAAGFLDVDPANVIIVGSAAVGISLNPAKNRRRFSSESDIDVAIISTHYFDLSWRTIRRLKLSQAKDHREAIALKDHAQRLVYWGCIATDRIARLLPFARELSVASIELSQLEPTGGRDVNFRFYRDFESLRMYHVNGIEKLGAKR